MGCGSNSCKTAYQKSCQRYYNNNAQALGANSTLVLTIAGARVVDTGLSIQTEPQSYDILKPGLYHISGDVIFTSSAAGNIVFEVLMDGVPMPCTIKARSIGATGTVSIHTETDIVVNGCCGVNKTLTFVVTSIDTGAGSITAFCSGVTKLA